MNKKKFFILKELIFLLFFTQQINYGHGTLKAICDDYSQSH